MNESIRIISYSGYPEGYWTNNDFESYNEIVNQNNDTIDWQTFNNRNEENKFNKEFKHNDEFKKIIKKRQTTTPEPQAGPSWLQPTPEPRMNLFDINLRTASIDLRNNMAVPMKLQEQDSWCAIAVLQNILANSQITNPNINNFSQQQLADLFSKADSSINYKGIYLFYIYRFMMENNFIKDYLGFSYSYFPLESFFFYILDNKEKFNLLQNLIWESLSRSVSVPVSGIIDSSSSQLTVHMFLIVGIQPNIDPLKTLYFVRDSDPEEDHALINYNNEKNTETSLTGQKLFDILFSNFEYGDLLINSEVYLQFIVAYIKYYSKIWNFQNLLAPIVDFRSPDLFSDDSSDDEENLLANTCFDFTSDSD